jgi:membrane protein
MSSTERDMPHHFALKLRSLAARVAGTRPAIFLRRVVEEWTRVDGTHNAAALAFYSVLSLTPFLLVIVAITGWLLGSDAATRYLLSQISNVAGAQSGQFIAGLISGAHPAALTQGVKALFGLVVTLVGATAVFAELQHGLDRVFGSRVSGAFALVRTRLLSFGLVVGVAVLSIASLMLSAAVHTMLTRVAHANLGRAVLGAITNEIVSFVVLACAFAAILRLLPERPPRQRSAIIGALTAAALFTIGKFAIGWYLAHFALTSAYGAAGAVVIVMLWIYWSSALFFAGAVVASVVDGRWREADEAQPGPGGIA